MRALTRRKILLDASRFGLWSLLSTLSPCTAGAREQRDKITINVGYLPITDHLILPVSHAIDSNHYKDINVRLHLCRSWDEVLGKMDIGLLNAAFLLAPLAMHTFQEKNLQCVMLGHRDGSVIAASPGINSAEELHRVPIGIPHQRSTHTALIYKYFKDHGITDHHDLQLKKIAPPMTVKELRSGVIKAYSVAEPWGIRGVSGGVVKILEYSKNIIPDHACCLLMVQKHFLWRQKEAMTEWVESLQKAGELIQQDPQKAAEFQAPYMHHEVDDILQVLDRKVISYSSLAPDRKTLQTIHDLAFEAGLIHDRMDMQSFIDPRFAG